MAMGIDATIARRRGEKSAAQGSDRDPGRSSPTPVVKARGLRACGRGRRMTSRRDRARHAVRLVRRWLPTRALIVVDAHPDAALEWREAVRHAVCGLTRVGRDVARDEPAPHASRARGGHPWRRSGRRP